MGRIAGVTSADTRERLLRGAAETFEASGYDGTRVADIAAAAGVSNGALYGHFHSKSELLAEALRDHGPRDLAAVFLDDPGRSVVDLLVALGTGLAEQPAANGSLVIEALVAARRDAEVATLTAAHLAERAEWLAGLVRDAQGDGAFDPALSPTAVARFSLMLALGSLLMAPVEVDLIERDAWSTLIERMGEALRPRATTAPPARTDPDSADPEGSTP